MSKRAVSTPDAPSAIGPYSQAIAAGDTVYLSGQVGIDPRTMELVPGIDAQIRQVFKNLAAVAEAAGGSLADAVRVTVYLTDLGNFGKVNEAMTLAFAAPHPARSTVGVASLPRGALVEVDAVLVVPHRAEAMDPPLGTFRFRDDQA